jgi:hypothetical protein
VAFIVIALIVISGYPFIAAILSFLSLLIFTARGGLEVDLEKKTYREYMSFLWVIRMGKPVKIKAVEYIFINSNNVSRKIYTAHTSQSSTFKDREYNAFIKFSNGDKVKIMSRKDKQPLLEYSSALAKQMETSLVDYTTEEQNQQRN